MSPSPLRKRVAAVKPAATNRFSRVSFRLAPKGFDPLLLELPQHLDLMAARLQNGENIFAVFSKQAQASGKFAIALRRMAVRLQLGESIEAALTALVDESDSPMVAELSNKVVLGLQRGTPMANQVQLLASAARAQLKVAQLRAAGRNELKMLIPLVFLILPVTIAFAVFPSLQLLRLGV
ncbi:MAG: hypothetical protein RJA35_502 [Actinomycetota bacterium]|jgi:tight adherence protein C